MTRDELMLIAADKAAKELSRESIEFLFQPRTFFELLLRLDFDGAVKKFYEALADGAVSRRHRDGPYYLGKRMIEVEEFYRAIKSALDEQFKGESQVTDLVCSIKSKGV